MFLDFFTHSKINTNNKKRYIEKNVKCYKNIHSWPKYVLCCLKMLSYLNWRMIFWVLVLVYILGNTQNKLLDNWYVHGQANSEEKSVLQSSLIHKRMQAERGYWQRVWTESAGKTSSSCRSTNTWRRQSISYLGEMRRYPMAKISHHFYFKNQMIQH